MTFTESTISNGDPHFDLSLIPDQGVVALVRHQVAGRLHGAGFSASTVDDVLSVVSELCTNAIDATASSATASSATPILVRVCMGPSEVIVEVDNAGRPFDGSAARAPLPVSDDDEGGRGLLIVRALTTEVTVRGHGDRCIVRAIIPGEGTGRSGP